MIDFKKEEENYQQIQLIKSALMDFRAYDIIRQAHIDIMYHFNISFKPTVNLCLTQDDRIQVRIVVRIGYSKPYNEIAHLATDIIIDNRIKAKFIKEYTFRGITFVIDDYLVADIPKEELTLLELLGKIDVKVVEAQPSTITKSIFCPSPFSDDISF